MSVGHRSLLQGQGEVRRERGEEHGKDDRQGKDQREQQRKGELEVVRRLILWFGKTLSEIKKLAPLRKRRFSFWLFEYE
jgi:hypothetical protein